MLVFGDGRELPMIKTQVEAGVEVILVTAASEQAIAEVVGTGKENVTVVRIPSGVNGFARAILEVVLVQLIADASADISGNIIEDYAGANFQVQYGPLLTSSYYDSAAIFTTAPDGTAWDFTKLNATQFGVKMKVGAS